jgi:hypothetical protein
VVGSPVALVESEKAAAAVSTGSWGFGCFLQHHEQPHKPLFVLIEEKLEHTNESSGHIFDTHGIYIINLNINRILLSWPVF